MTSPRPSKRSDRREVNIEGEDDARLEGWKEGRHRQAVR
jgi:hypothetical protein